MIGAAHSPMSMFTGGTGDAFQRGMVIGDANSPFSPVARAMQGTLEKYNSHIAAQTEQANKVDLMKQQYGFQKDNLLSGIKEKYDQSAPQISAEEKALYDPLNPQKNTVKISGIEMYREPVYDSYGRIKGFKLRNPRALSMMDIVGAGDPGGGGAEADVASTLQELDAL
jgi:hypothetical protein